MSRNRRSREKSFWKVLSAYFSNTSIHGLQYLSKDGLHWSERLFWFIVCSFSCYYCTFFIVESWRVFQNNPISFVVDTNYLYWDTYFPAVSVCEEDNMKRVFKLADEIFGKDHDYNLDEVIREIAYFRGNWYYIPIYCDEQFQCPQNGLEEIARKVRSPCEEVFKKCEWNGKPFDCCSEFIQIETEVGTCYTVNGIQGGDNIRSNFMISNRSSGPGSLTVKIKVQSRVYLHSSEDVPFLNSQDSLVTSSSVQITRRFSVHEVQNGEDVKDIDVEKRRCKFSFETEEGNAYPRYSYSACLVECRMVQEMQKCNCTPPLTPNASPEDICDLPGLLCLNEHFGTLSVLKSEWNHDKNGLYCPCDPSCEEIEINIIEDYANSIEEDMYGVELILDSLPSERYLRTVVRGKLDLAVALGGTCGLFVGASLLSAMEFFYYFFIKLFCSISRRRSHKGEKN